MRNKILFSDLDDTLLKKDKTISEEDRNAIVKMLEQGHYFVVATGKPIEVGRNVITELGLTMPGCYMIAFNGAVVYDCASNRYLMEHTLPLEIVKEIFEEAEAAGIHVQTYQMNSILTHEHDEALDFYLERAKMDYRLVPNIFECIEKEPHKVLAINIDSQEPLLNLQAGLLKKHPNMEEHCNCFFSCDEYLEFCPKDVNKGLGVKYLSEFLNVPLEDTVAVGDERNDISMIKAAKIGVAVKNASENVKKAADYITENDHEHNAVAEVIERFILGKKEN